MTQDPLPQPLRGIVPPMVTPLADEDSLDQPGLERLIEHVLAGGVHGLFVLGTTGEGPSLSHALRHKLLEQVCDQVAGRVPVLVGVTDTSLAESVELAERACDAGAQAVVAAPPYYLPVGQPELFEYFAKLAAAVPLPLVLYNMPSCTKAALEVETVLACSQLDNIIGLKDSSGDLEYFVRVRAAVAQRPEFTLLVGPEELLAQSMELGAHGGISGGANLWPRLYVDLYEAAAVGDTERVEHLHAAVMRISNSIYRVGRYDSRIIKGIKASLGCLGVCSDEMAPPFQRFAEPERERIRQLLAELGVPRSPAVAAAAN
jgi:4-hydroxy-tetrahydrodipicolinate synthase